MKYLKPFNERLSDEDTENFRITIMDNVEAIIGPLSDYDYDYTINFVDSKINIVIYTDNEESYFIKGIEIKEPVLMLMDYLNKKDFKDVDLKVWDDDDYVWKELSEFDNANIDDLRKECIEVDQIKIVGKL
jgi:hypothetical protein